MPGKNRLTPKIKWQPIVCDDQTMALLPLLMTDQFPDRDFSDVALTSSQAAEYFGLSRMSVYEFLRKHRDLALVKSGIHYFPLPALDRLIRGYLPKEPLIHSSMIPACLNLSRSGYWKLYQEGKVPTFRFGAKTWITYSNLENMRKGKPCEPARLKTFQ